MPVSVGNLLSRVANHRPFPLRVAMSCCASFSLREKSPPRGFRWHAAACSYWPQQGPRGRGTTKRHVTAWAWLRSTTPHVVGAKEGGSGCGGSGGSAAICEVSTAARTVRIGPVKRIEAAMSGTASVRAGVKRSGKARAHGTNHRKLERASNGWPGDGQGGGEKYTARSARLVCRIHSACEQHKMTDCARSRLSSDCRHSVLWPLLHPAVPRSSIQHACLPLAPAVCNASSHLHQPGLRSPSYTSQVDSLTCPRPAAAVVSRTRRRRQRQTSGQRRPNQTAPRRCKGCKQITPVVSLPRSQYAWC
jgi:hypothetical protein